MKTLRAWTWLRRALLVGFLCVMGVSAASPYVHPTRTQWVCAGAGGVALVVLTDDGLPTETHLLDCPLCLPAAGPAPLVVASLPSAAPADSQPFPPAPTSVCAQSGAPPPGRGPPVFS
ncbi:DUF2946 domain-containing protein [Simplicispira suum]|uniref:DUF2946 domain-containing protein n=1 Tax=Simplicispira suum TaxID=2109915 RepID=UPI0011B2753E|nr:DUF2946 domain-containing protein [Simplicispira suum]